MPDFDLGILEILIIFFMFLPAIRPFVKALWPMEGLAWFPVIALFCVIGAFFVYGFRPECIPLFLYIIIINITNIGALSAHILRLRNTDFIDRKCIVFLINIFFLACSACTAVFFLPLSRSDLISENVQSAAIKDDKSGNEYTIRVYQTVQYPSRPVVLVVPPVAGSAGVVDMLCRSISEQGNITVSFSRKKFDTPAFKENGKTYVPSVREVANNWNVFTRGLTYKKENAIARDFEEQRKRDIIFMMRYIQKNWPANKIMVSGYGTGGAAAVMLAEDSAFLNNYPAFCGVIAIESYFYAAFDGEAGPPLQDESGFFMFEFITNIKNKLKERKPVRISGPNATPRPQIPVMFIISDNIYTIADFNIYGAVERISAERRDNVYIKIIQNVRMFDWTDVPQKYPVLRFICAPFRESGWDSAECAKEAALVFQDFVTTVCGTGTGERETSQTTQ